MKKLLYVEDELALARIVRESLEARGFEVMWVGDGRKVMAAFRDFEPDLCLLDVMLPGTDGFSLGKEIRGVNSLIPIIFLTAKDQTKDVLQGFGSGGNDYIRKPFSLEELIARINNLLQISHRQPQNNATLKNNIPLGKYIFSPSTFELILNDKQQKLSHRETQLLLILSGNMNAISKRKDILMKIWGDDSFFNSRNLDVYIKKMRNYLSQDADVQIVTLKGVGYQFVVKV